MKLITSGKKTTWEKRNAKNSILQVFYDSIRKNKIADNR